MKVQGADGHAYFMLVDAVTPITTGVDKEIIDLRPTCDDLTVKHQC